jgi:hypothetical protein
MSSVEYVVDGKPTVKSVVVGLEPGGNGVSITVSHGSYSQTIAILENTGKLLTCCLCKETSRALGLALDADDTIKVI